MTRCPVCQRVVLHLKAAPPRACSPCEVEIRERARRRMARVNEHWAEFRRTRDKAAGVDHLERALRHARVLDSYRKVVRSPVVPAPRQVLGLLERAKRQALLGPQGLHFDGEKAGGQNRGRPSAWAEGGRPGPAEGDAAPTVIFAGPPEEAALAGASDFHVVDLSGEALDERARCWDRDGAPAEPDGAEEIGFWLGEPEGEEEAPVERRRHPRRGAPGLSACVLGREGTASVADVSVGGASLLTSAVEVVGTRVALVIRNGSKRMGALGVVRWAAAVEASDRPGAFEVGLEFLRLNFFRAAAPAG